jgi:hypothetical protein
MPKTIGGKMKPNDLRQLIKEAVAAQTAKPKITRRELKEVIKATLRTILNEGFIDTPPAQMAEGQMSPDELQSTWEDDKQGEYIQINPDDSVVYVAHGRAMEQIAPKGSGRDMFRLIGSWMKANQYFPNIWQVNDHGNVELYSKSGKPLGGLVETLKETTTTGDVAPINLPGNVKGGWVSGAGGSRRGVAGSAALGYELTSIGKKDMKRKQDKVYEQ